MIRLRPGEDHGLALAAIQIDGGTQSRATLNDQVVNDYAEAIKAGATFPPIIVFYDGKKHWLADGFHRFHAYQKAGKAKVAADVRQGTRRDAILHSVGANETHGLRRTRDDKRRAVLTLLNDAEWSKWTDRQIAAACLVDHKTVAKARLDVTGEIPSERTYTTKHGTTATMKTAGINASRTQFQAKASEDNGSITGGAGAVTGEASRLASGRTDAGEAASVDLPTISDAERDADAIQSVWDRAGEQGRATFLARNQLQQGSAVVEARAAHNREVAGSTPAPATSSAAPTAEPEATPSLMTASGNPINPDPHTPGRATAAPANQVSQPPAQNDGAPLTVGQGGHGPVDHCGHAKQEPAVEPQGRNEPVSGEAASVTNLNPRCRKPDTCKWAHSQVSCSACANAWTKRSAAA